MSEPDLVAGATRTIENGSKSFAAAARLFDRPTRESAVLLYAWCRHCDDVVDDQVLGFRGVAPPVRDSDPVAALERQTLDALGDGPLLHPAFAGLREVVRRHDIPARYPLQHLDGFRMDVAGRPYQTLHDTLDYAYHVAGVVGVMMARIMGVHDAATLDHASDLGIAFQLTNIARDIVDDAAAGRVYVPAEWLAEAGILPEALADPAYRERLARVAARLLDEAEPYYASAQLGIARLPRRSAWAIGAAHGIYRQIGVTIRARGRHAWDERASTSAAQKMRHVSAAGLRALNPALRSDVGPARIALYERPPF